MGLAALNDADSGVGMAADISVRDQVVISLGLEPEQLRSQ